MARCLYVDGTLRDLYVLGTTSTDWQSFIDFVRALPLPVTYRLNDQTAHMPADASDVLALREHTSPLLCIDLHGLILNVHFFTEDEIELDLTPNDDASESQLDALLDFMRSLAQAVGKPVRLTPENVQHIPLIEVFPDGNVLWWHPDSEAQA